MQSVFLFIPKIFSGVEVLAQVTQNYPYNAWRTISLKTLLAQERCVAGYSSVSANKCLKVCVA